MVDVNITLAEESFMKPIGGIVLYEDSTNAKRVVASRHDVHIPDEGAPEFLAGNPLTWDDISELGDRLGRNKKSLKVLPECVLAVSPEAVVWWRPETRRSMFLNTKIEKLDALSGVLLLHPPLVFMGGRRSLKVFALRESKRPGPDTEMMQAPYFNVYGGGGLCVGSATIPEIPLADEECLQAYETAFFDSSFTHSTLGNKELVNYTGGHNGLWQSMALTSWGFPGWALKSLPTKKLTLAEAL